MRGVAQSACGAALLADMQAGRLESRMAGSGGGIIRVNERVRASVQEYVQSQASYHADDVMELEEDLMCLLPALAPMFDASCAFHQHNRNQDLGGKVWALSPSRLYI